MAILEVEHVCKSFDQTEVLKDISFQLEKSQVLFHHRFLRQRKDNAAALPEFSGDAGPGHHPCQRENAV